MTDPDAPHSHGDEESERRPSWPYPQFIIIFVVLLLLAPMLGMVGAVLLAAWVGYYLWSALSKSYYESMRESYPSLSRPDYILNMLLIPTLFVFALIGFFIIVYLFRSA